MQQRPEQSIRPGVSSAGAMSRCQLQLLLYSLPQLLADNGGVLTFVPYSLVLDRSRVEHI